MRMLKNGDLILENQQDIEGHVLSYYESLYASDNVCSDSDFVQNVIPKMVSNEDNSLLTRPLSLDEVKAVVFGMNGSSAPGSDGFGDVFFQSFWDIIGADVFNLVSQFFSSGWILPNLNSNIVILIPKFDGADKIEDFRPIALANFQFKIITKVIADRLATIAPKIVSIQEKGFLRGRNISEFICMTSEAMKMLDYKTFGGNVALKLDIKRLLIQ